MRRALLAVACVSALVVSGVSPADSSSEMNARWTPRPSKVHGHPKPFVAPGGPLPVLQGIRATPSPTTSPPAPSYSGGILSEAEVAGYLRAAGFPESVIPTMVAIAWRESRFNPRAVNPSSGACGLWQLYPCPGSEALGPMVNAELAYAKFRAAGLAPWGG